MSPFLVFLAISGGVAWSAVGATVFALIVVRIIDWCRKRRSM